LGIKISGADPGYYKYIAAIKKSHPISLSRQFNC
jgi:hypothetical protein